MEDKLKSAEIIVNKDGSIYHLCLYPEQVSRNIILVGDPFRVDSISKYLTNIEFTTQNREFKSTTGYYKDNRITVVSTGIGGSNIDIVINELDALFNYDFKNKKFKKNHSSFNIIRIGTSGSVLKDLKINSFLISEYAIDINSQLSLYDLDNYESNKISKILLNKKSVSPVYLFKSDNVLFNKFYVGDINKGITATCNGFYAFQGRKTRMSVNSKLTLKDICDIKIDDIPISNLEMETAIIYGLCDFLGHNAISLNAILANRIEDEYSSSPKKIIDSLINFVLEKI